MNTFDQGIAIAAESARIAARLNERQIRMMIRHTLARRAEFYRCGAGQNFIDRMNAMLAERFGALRIVRQDHEPQEPTR